MRSAPQILLRAASSDLLEQVARLLLPAGFQITPQVFASNLDDSPPCQLLLLDGSTALDAAVEHCRRFRQRLGDLFVPILFLGDAQRGDARRLALEAGADVFLVHPCSGAELLAQVQALLRIKESHDRLADKAAEVHRINRRLQHAYKQIDEELELARRIQVSLLPQKMPELPSLRFAVHYVLCGQVGGDFYDVFRLDENHVGFYVADAMGHGLPASLLTIFVKRGVRAKEVFGRDYRLVPPGEVLHRLNRDLLDQGLSEDPFITMAYGLLNHRDGTLRFSRAGHPYPLHVPGVGEPRLLESEGLLLGVFEAQFANCTCQLQPGDKLLFYSDGIDGARFEGHDSGGASLLACAARHRALPVGEFVETLARDLFGAGSQPDDLTLLGVEMLA
jgi:sigma-B regulation protein RsbU (phosphoserine phosphatase)